MTGLSNSEQRLVDRIEPQPIIERTLAWASINSGTGNLAGLAAMADRLADAFSTLPGDTALLEPAAVERIDGDGQLAPVASGRHLLLRVRPRARARMLLTGHMDTVFAVEHPFQACEWLDQRRLRGPGTADMKGGLALMLAGLTAFEGTGPKLGYDVFINSDEETGSPSSERAIRDLAQGKLAALTYEPALPGGAMARARPGSGNFAAVVTGRSAHAGRNPDEGRNALLAAADLALRLSRARRPGLMVNPARIDGGAADNMVPARAVLRFNLRPLGKADADEAAVTVEQAIAEVAREREVTIALHGGFGRPPKPVGAAAERLFALVAESAADLGGDLQWRDTGGVCDGNNIAACAVPVIDTMGACGGMIHSPEEFVLTDSLEARARLTALTLHRIDRGRFHR